MSSLVEPGWEALARSPRFQALVSDRRRFVVRATVFYTAYLVAYLALLGYGKDFMAKEVLGALSLAFLGGLSICALTRVMAIGVPRRSAKWERMASASSRRRADEAPRRHGRLQRAGRRRLRCVLAVTL
jgi:uncharacterized membrane protein (DUF485 family)